MIMTDEDFEEAMRELGEEKRRLDAGRADGCMR